ncbi:MAG: hypothetical protein WC506_04740 [Candidatus Micrarchaeia archaeon]
MVHANETGRDFMPAIRRMSLNRRVGLAVFLIFGFLFLSFAIIFTYAVPSGTSLGIFEPLVMHHLEFMALMAILGLAVGAAIVYLLYEKIETQEKASGITAELVLKFLTGEERRIVLYLAKSGGSSYQSEISRLEGFTRLRAHRAISRLESKGILSIDKVGKTNRLSLGKALFQALEAHAPGLMELEKKGDG